MPSSSLILKAGWGAVFTRLILFHYRVRKRTANLLAAECRWNSYICGYKLIGWNRQALAARGSIGMETRKNVRERRMEKIRKLQEGGPRRRYGGPEPSHMEFPAERSLNGPEMDWGRAIEHRHDPRWNGSASCSGSGRGMSIPTMKTAEARQSLGQTVWPSESC